MPADLPAHERTTQPEQFCYIAYSSGMQVPFIIIGEPRYSSSSYINWGTNSGAQTVLHAVDADILSSYQNQFQSNRQFIKLEQSFDEQFLMFKQFLGTESPYVIKEKLRLSADAILNYQPDSITLQLTAEGSIFYTFIKDDYKIFFQHFLVDHFDDADEAIVSIYKNGNNISNHAGTLSEMLMELNQIFSTSTHLIPALT